MGIQHRVKRTADGEARPTRVFIIDGEATNQFDLATETDELDFLMCRFPAAYAPLDGDTLAEGILPRHHKWRTVRKDEDVSQLPPARLRVEGGKTQIAIGYPMEVDGLFPGDRVAMGLGGSGDRFAYALSRRGEAIGATVFRIPPFVLKTRRDEKSKDNDAGLVARLLESSPELFAEMTPRERALVRVVEAYRARQDAMKDRIACEQRIRQRLIGKIFLNAEGHYPEGQLEDLYDAQKASDAHYVHLEEEERALGNELARSVRALDVWDRVFEPMEGCGERLAAGIIAAVGDVRRFATKSKFKAFLGVHVLRGGKHGEVPTEKQFPRRRAGSVANWSADARQSLYLLADQANRRADSFWGQKLREYKVKLREKHPVTECKQCGVAWEECTSPKSHTRRYFDGHIHKMAIWRTATKIAEAIYRDWWKLERELAGGESQRERKAA
jgi:Transposase IS116/IS110/IS902 family